ncbi:Anion-transporting ATPase, ArsA/GET3 family [Microlunatus sagamiharensis]|uniref:Anion-transporting ATPase, ArsA/GET3 family n=1 Tax=Microlunatus sagamiharensis TaxID=546874 RepID=A0A1H2NE38_9ACTN|nr:ArsA-related P-loop ATPase [Microlunatus sagamiharensis]SDV03680.1 Anion-transporting ATPase, ArsA/GET3 family [Microlunatus sagamiharensis]
MTAPRHTLHVVSGKGGTGKTTVAAGLACALATRGRRVLLCEVEGRQGLAELFGVPPLEGDEERRLTRTPAGGTVFGLSIDAEDALREYLETFYHLGLAGRALDRFGVIDFVTSIAPGLRDVLLTGKVYEAVRRGEKGLPTAYDAVVLDAPPTGRIGQFLNIHDAVSGIAKVGPIRAQADSVAALLRARTTITHLVTLLEDMPVSETEEAVAALQPSGTRVGTIIENMVNPSPFEPAVLADVAAGSVDLAVPGWDDTHNRALAAEFAVEASRTLEQQVRHDRLLRLGLPLVQVDFDPLGIDAESLFAVAEQLTDQLALEAA